MTGYIAGLILTHAPEDLTALAVGQNDVAAAAVSARVRAGDVRPCEVAVPRTAVSVGRPANCTSPFSVTLSSVLDATEQTDLDSPVAVLESAVNASPGRITLVRDDQGRLLRRTIHDAANPAGAAAFLAEAAITIATTPGSGRLLICDRPACNMRFFQKHRRRRYCNPACANSDRQTRFQRRQKN